MAGTPKLILTDVPFVGDVEKPGEHGLAGQESVSIVAKAARAVVAAKAKYDEHQAEVERAYGALKAFCRTLAVQFVAIRREFVNSAGEIDWRGQSNAYKRCISLNIYEPMFGAKPEGVDRNVWRRESGYGSFVTTMDRAIQEYVDEQSAAAKLNGLTPADPDFIPVGALKRDESDDGPESDSKALVRLARESKVVRKADGPDVQALLNTAETALRMMVAYGDPDNPQVAPGLLKLTPSEATAFEARLVKLTDYAATIGRVVSAKLAAAEAEQAATQIETSTPEPTTEKEAVAV